jgi:Family of unknown function (DUF5367)
MNKPLVLCGLAIWAAGTITLRLAGQRILHPASWTGTLILFAVSFPLMGWIARRLCHRFKLPRDQWLGGAVSIALPTLLLDPFSSAFFPAVFPNIAPEAAGIFGGWMLCCCAGALVGVLFGPSAAASHYNPTRRS